MAVTQNETWQFPICIPHNPLKKTIKNLTGKLIQIARPSIRASLLAGKSPSDFWERAVLTSIFLELKTKNQLDKLAELHKQIWASANTQGYYEVTSKRLQGMFEQLKELLYSTISTLTSKKEYQELVELGCGEGIIVAELSKKFPAIRNFVGIDINNVQIELNKLRFKELENLQFVSGDFTIDANLIKGPTKIYLSFGGVLEYLTEKELISLFEELAALKDIVFILYEPIKAGFDIKHEKHSILYGGEFSFSHPYHHLLTASGFKVLNEQLMVSSDTHWIYLVCDLNPVHPSGLVGYLPADVNRMQ